MRFNVREREGFRFVFHSLLMTASRESDVWVCLVSYEVRRKILKANQVEGQIRLDIEPVENTRRGRASACRLDHCVWMQPASRIQPASSLHL